MRKSTPIQYVYRFASYVLGMFFLAFGVAISINSNFGISPVNSLPYVVSMIIKKDLGSCVTGVFCVYLLLQIIILRKDFKIINLLQIVFSFMIGTFVNIAKAIVGTWALPGLAGRCVMLFISIVFIAIGVIFYVDVQLVPMPMEGLTLTIAQKLKKPFPTMKSVVDCVVVGTGIVLSFVFLGGLYGIGIGTVITAIVTGKFVAFFRKPILPILHKICFGGSIQAQ